MLELLPYDIRIISLERRAKHRRQPEQPKKYCSSCDGQQHKKYTTHLLLLYQQQPSIVLHRMQPLTTTRDQFNYHHQEEIGYYKYFLVSLFWVLTKVQNYIRSQDGGALGYASQLGSK